ncbi:hypothetical protein EDB81DRAFT_763622 [Dactylonectria macrodidyma]|uniref:Alpha/beta hydrolase fold-3 domain-containing protein n=1 Tax=Dactylonectria macrodidyma TaxID=307937 RepID=A0A9P9E4W3_9HYPO|nr:hypothetical protein EDB81DRAFT_763622 [Dactylonectria macrodidyma]
MENLDEVLHDLKTAAKTGQPIVGYAIPEDEHNKRMGWITALHEAAIYPDILCGTPGLSSLIRNDGLQSLPYEVRQFFRLDFGLDLGFPPTAFLHGDKDSCVDVAQSILAAEKLREAGVKTCLEVVPGKEHGFDVIEVAPDANFEAKGESSVLAVHLKSILHFLGQIVNQ